MKTYTEIKHRGISANIWLPRLGKIRLGIKQRTKAGKEYPVEVDYFVVPDEVAQVYGDTPKELDVRIPMPLKYKNYWFPQRLEWYGSGAGLKCQGDGETAIRWNQQKKEWIERSCPCEQLGDGGECTQKARLMIQLPKVSEAGVYQIDTSAVTSITNINSALMLLAINIGDVHDVTLKLKRKKHEMTTDGARRTHYVMALEWDKNFAELMEERARMARMRNVNYRIARPDETNPKLDGPVYDVETGEILHDEEPRRLTARYIDEAETEPEEETEIVETGVATNNDDGGTGDTDNAGIEEPGETEVARASQDERSPASWGSLDEFKKSIKAAESVMEVNELLASTKEFSSSDKTLAFKAAQQKIKALTQEKK